GLLHHPWARSEQRLQPVAAATTPPLRRHRRRRRRALAHPAVLDRDIGAERADVHVVDAAVRREADRPLSHQERALADRTRPTDLYPRAPRHTKPRVLGGNGLSLLLGGIDQFLRDVGRHFL